MLASLGRTVSVAVALVAAALPAGAGSRRKAAPTPAPASGATTALRQEGTRAYRAGRYDEALAKFRAAADRDHDDPDALADVALALQKLGRIAEAVTANQGVVRLAARPSADKAKRFAKVRLAAYFNLGRLGALVPVPDVGACSSLAPATDTCKPMYACREARQNNGSGLATLWEVLRIARTNEAAILDEDDYHEVPPLIRGLTDAEYDTEAGRPAIDLLPEQEGDTLLRYGTEEVGDECRRIYGDWSCDTSEEVRAETRRCQGTSGPADGGTAACFRLSCDRAESAPWPAVQAEIDRRTQRLASCYERLGQLDDTTCVVVYADPCSGLVGSYCTTSFHRTSKPRAEHHRVFELTAPQD
jgi:tetratricopeptide (TPR) repeat protein